VWQLPEPSRELPAPHNDQQYAARDTRAERVP
jgi:hypothetical protein